MPVSMWIEVALLAIVAIVAIAIAAVAWKLGISRPPQSWIVRAGAFAIGTTLLATALLAPDIVGKLADLAFKGSPSDAGAHGAEVAVRLTLAALATAALVVPGTWMDVGFCLVVVLAFAAIRADYADREKTLRCGQKPALVTGTTTTPATSSDCDSSPGLPTVAPGAVRVLLPQDRTVAPTDDLPANVGAAVFAIVEERDPDGRIRTFARRYSVTPPAAVPKKLTGDVAVDIVSDPAARYEQFLADVTAAKKLRLMPR